MPFPPRDDSGNIENQASFYNKHFQTLPESPIRAFQSGFILTKGPPSSIQPTMSSGGFRTEMLCVHLGEAETTVPFLEELSIQFETSKLLCSKQNPHMFATV